MGKIVLYGLLNSTELSNIDVKSMFSIDEQLMFSDGGWVLKIVFLFTKACFGQSIHIHMVCKMLVHHASSST